MPLADEVAAKGVAYIWSNTRINPLGELFKATVGVVQGKKRFRNLVKIPVLVGGMAGGAYIFVANPWDWALMEAITTGPVSDFVTGVVGAWVGGSASWTVGKQFTRLWNQAIGGDTNSEYNLSINNTKAIMKAAGYIQPEPDDELENEAENAHCFSNFHPGRTLANNISLHRLPAAIEHRYHCDEACQNIEEFHGVIQYFINLATRYKNDGTSRHAEIKHPLSELLTGRLQPAIDFLRTRKNKKEASSEEAHELVEELDALLGDEPHCDRGEAGIELRDQVRMGNLSKAYSTCLKATQYHNLYDKSATKPRVTTWGDVQNLHEKAKLYEVKQQVEAESSDRVLGVLTKYCSPV